MNELAIAFESLTISHSDARVHIIAFLDQIVVFARHYILGGTSMVVGKTLRRVSWQSWHSMTLNSEHFRHPKS